MPYPFRAKCCKGDRLHYETMRVHNVNPWAKNVVDKAFAAGDVKDGKPILFVGNNNQRYIERALALAKARGWSCPIEVADVDPGANRTGAKFIGSRKALEKAGVKFTVDRIYKRRYPVAFIVYALEGICPEKNRLCLLSEVQSSLVKEGALWIDMRGRGNIVPFTKKGEDCDYDSGCRTNQATYVKVMSDTEVKGLVQKAGFAKVECTENRSRNLQFRAQK